MADRDEVVATEEERPRVVVLGLGPAAADLIPGRSLQRLAAARRRFVRTARHPAVAGLEARIGPFTALDEHYEDAASFEEVYRAIVETLVAAAIDAAPGEVAYAVPGSPLIAERTVELLRSDGRVRCDVEPALSFLDLAWDRLGVDPVASGVALVDATALGGKICGPGPILIAQCHHPSVLSEVKLAVEEPWPERAVLLHHLGLPDEQVVEVSWADIDRTLPADHLTSLYVADLPAPAGRAIADLEELVRTLRERCPWDRAQTHGSLARHLLEEAHEALEAIDAVDVEAADVEAAEGGAAEGGTIAADAVTHLEEELGDVLFQVCFHARLASESGWFTLADVARAVREKLVARHPHVFGDATATTPAEVAERWEQIKQREKGRQSVFEGIPASLPALALAAKVQSKIRTLGASPAGPPAVAAELVAATAELRSLAELAGSPGTAGSGSGRAAGRADAHEAVGRVLLAVTELGHALDVDAESALRRAAGELRRTAEAREYR